LETKFVDAGQNKYNKDLFDMTFNKNELLEVHFLKRSVSKGIFKMFYQLKKMWPRPRAGRCPGLL